MKNRIGKSFPFRKALLGRGKNSRVLHLEALEGRRLLSADTPIVSNMLIAEDVNRDFRVNALDALIVINELNARNRSVANGEGEASGSSSKSLYLDVNRDGRLSALDALLIINRLNGEGETDTLIRYSYTITNTVDPNDPTSGTPLTQVAVGQTFQINVFVQDVRDPFPPAPAGGVRSAGLDIGINSLDFASFQFTTDFASGILYSSNFPDERGVFPSGEITTEFFNEVKASSFSLGAVPNPSSPRAFFSTRFVATNPGVMTFTGRGATDDVDLVNFIDIEGEVPNANIDFGLPFSITIVADPNIPVANPDTLVTRAGVSRTITNAELLSNDTGVDLPLTVTGIQTLPGTQGTLVGNVYTPLAGFTGSDTLAYTIRDAQNRTATGTITINVLPAIVANDDAFTIQVDSSNNILEVLTNDTPTGLTITQVTTPSQGGTVSIVSGNRLRYTPAASFRGTETFVYTVRDNGGDGVRDTATVTITVVDRLPAAGSFSVNVNEATQNNSINVLANVQANEGQQPILIRIGSQPANGTVSIDDNGTPNDLTDDRVLFTPNPGFVGTDSFTYVANDTSDPREPDSTGTVTVNVLEVNRPPIVVNDTVNSLEKQQAVIPIATLLSNDRAFLEGQSLTLTSVRPISTAGGSVQIQGTNVVYTPNPNYFFGQFLFEYTVTDDFVRPLSAVGTVTVNVAPVNDPPIIPSDIQFRAFKNAPLTIPVAEVLRNVQPGPPNESDQTLSITAVGPNATNNGANVGTVVLNAAAGTITFTPNQDYTGPARFNITVRDNGGTANGGVDTAQGQVTVNVEEFQPSTIAGKVFVDENRDGAMNGRERALGGIEVTLTGTSLGQQVAPRSVLTLSDGTYDFEDLGPGSYQVTFKAPAFMLASSSFSTSHTVQIAEPGGLTVGRDYAVVGFSAQYAQWVSQLVSSYYYTDPTLAVRGAMFAIGSNNSLLWGMKLDGYSSAKFTEAVFDGDHLLLTTVDANNVVRTARLTRSEYAFVRDSSGNTLVRVLGSMNDFSWTQVNRNSPPFQASMYLNAVDKVFDQEGWQDAM